jgi:hypothetical protein
VRRTLPRSAEIEAQIDQLLAVGVGENPRESRSELARLGARLIIQRAVEDEFDAWLGRARYERRPDYQRGLPQLRLGTQKRLSPAAGADRRGRAFGRDPAGARGRGAVRLRALPALDEAASHPARRGRTRSGVAAHPRVTSTEDSQLAFCFPPASSQKGHGGEADDRHALDPRRRDPVEVRATPIPV